MLDENAIAEIVMDSDSDENYACEDMDEELKLPLTSEDWTHGTIHIGRTAVINRAVVACVPRGVWSGA